MNHIVVLEPYHAGSHRAWLEGYMRHSSHHITALTLPGRFWKWRMHGAAVTLARRFIASDVEPDLILATDMLDLTTFQALTRRHTAHIPFALYLHENQLTYPVGPRQKRDLRYGFVNYSSMLAADRVFFNSGFHMEAFFDELPRLLKHFPDYNELWSIKALRDRSQVLPLGLDLQRFDAHQTRGDGPLHIVWNHRWEYDKQPAAFFDALYALQRAGRRFQVSVLGKCFRQRPEEFLEAQERLGDHIVDFGYLDSFEAYARALWRADLQVSTAVQEFFGASTAEAIYCGCTPLLPNRLNYPAFVPQKSRAEHLYDSQAALIEKLTWACEHVDAVRRTTFRDHISQYDWQLMAPLYDACLTS